MRITNCAQKSQDNIFWKKGRSPDPGPAWSRLSCGLRLTCSGVLPVKMWNVPNDGDSSTILAAVPPLGCTQGERVFYAQLDLCMLQLVLLPLTFPQTTLEPGCIFSISSCQCQGCCWVPLKLCLLPAEPALFYRISLQNKDLSCTTLVEAPILPPVLSTLRKQQGSCNESSRWLDMVIGDMMAKVEVFATALKQQ